MLSNNVDKMQILIIRVLMCMEEYNVSAFIDEINKAVTRIFFGGGGVTLSLNAVGAEGDRVWGGGVHLPRKFLHFFISKW